jgi:hypothetical protein
MGLFNDIIRDAHRPLAAGRLRRSPDEAGIEAPLEQPDLAPEEPDSGMHTVFRFQKGESPAASGGSREASPRSRARTAGALTADPLSTGAEVEAPEPSVNESVSGNEGISVVEVNRGSELATGQVRHVPTDKMAAANVKSESHTHPSASLSERVETESFREVQKSDIPESRERSVSGNEVASQSRPSGRGASPSETPPPDGPHGGESSITKASTRPAADPGPAWGRPNPPPGWDRSAHDAGLTNEPTPALQPATPPSPPADAPPVERPLRRPLKATSAISPRTPEPPVAVTSARRPAPGPPESASPSLVIGRLDVVVVADPPARSKGTAAPQSSGAFLNRNYLKRL